MDQEFSATVKHCTL